MSDPAPDAAPDPAADAAVDALLVAVRGAGSTQPDADAVREVLARHPAGDWPALAARARAVWKHELSGGGDVDRAMRAALAANVVYAAAGDEPRSLAAGFDFLQTQFMLADDPEAYAGARRRLAALADRAAELGLAEQAFEATTTAADCAYFAAELLAGPARAPVLDALLGDLVAAAAAALRCADARAERPAAFEKFVSLTAAAYQSFEEGAADLAVARAWDAGGAAGAAGRDERLRALAAAVETLVPDDYAFAHGDAHKAAHAAGVLARLSARYGSRGRARARLGASLAGDS